MERHTGLVRGYVRCFPEGSNAPVVDAPRGAGVILVGQEPTGVTQITTRGPFTGPAGRRLECWLAEAGVSRAEKRFPLGRC